MSDVHYAAERETFAGVGVIALRDETAKDEALVAPGAGANCFRLRVHAGERRVDVLAGPAEEGLLRQGGSSFGIPILFPFPNRVRGARYRFRGKEYALEANSSGNHIHGLVLRRAWQVEATGAGDDVGAWVRCGIRSTDDAEMGRQFPFPFHLTVTYALKEGGLRVETAVRNTGTGEMPMGVGLHPWFPAPLVPDGRREQVEVRVPARRIWELEGMNPTGRTLPVEGKFDLRRLTALGDREYDDVFTDIERDESGSACLLRDPACPVDVEVHADAQFREWVLYAPLRRATVCLEPYTCATNAVNLQEQGVDAGLLVLRAGEEWRGVVRIGTRRREG